MLYKSTVANTGIVYVFRLNNDVNMYNINSNWTQVTFRIDTQNQFIKFKSLSPTVFLFYTYEQEMLTYM